jgi:arylformamidase
MMLACVWKAFAADLPAGLVKNALSISGLYDLEPLRHAPNVKDSLKLTPAQVRKVSPALLPVPRDRMLYSVAGGNESAEFLRHNQLIQQAWGKKTVLVCEELPGLHHFSVLNALVDPAHRLHQLALQLIAKA